MFNFFFFFFFNDTATTEIYTLSLHDALPIFAAAARAFAACAATTFADAGDITGANGDRKSTRLNSSHLVISYAVFCLKKKKKHRVMITSIIHNKVITTLMSLDSQCRDIDTHH